MSTPPEYKEYKQNSTSIETPSFWRLNKEETIKQLFPVVYSLAVLFAPAESPGNRHRHLFASLDEITTWTSDPQGAINFLKYFDTNQKNKTFVLKVKSHLIEHKLGHLLGLKFFTD
jgi:hypothetical protein